MEKGLNIPDIRDSKTVKGSKSNDIISRNQETNIESKILEKTLENFTTSKNIPMTSEDIYFKQNPNTSRADFAKYSKMFDQIDTKMTGYISHHNITRFLNENLYDEQLKELYQTFLKVKTVMKENSNYKLINKYEFIHLIVKLKELEHNIIPETIFVEAEKLSQKCKELEANENINLQNKVKQGLFDENLNLMNRNQELEEKLNETFSIITNFTNLYILLTDHVADTSKEIRKLKIQVALLSTDKLKLELEKQRDIDNLSISLHQIKIEYEKQLSDLQTCLQKLEIENQELKSMAALKLTSQHNKEINSKNSSQILNDHEITLNQTEDSENLNNILIEIEGRTDNGNLVSIIDLTENDKPMFEDNLKENHLLGCYEESNESNNIKMGKYIAPSNITSKTQTKNKGFFSGFLNIFCS